jgi:hypothetical protein
MTMKGIKTWLVCCLPRWRPGGEEFGEFFGGEDFNADGFVFDAGDIGQGIPAFGDVAGGTGEAEEIDNVAAVVVAGAAAAGKFAEPIVDLVGGDVHDRAVKVVANFFTRLRRSSRVFLLAPSFSRARSISS